LALFVLVSARDVEFLRGRGVDGLEVTSLQAAVQCPDDEDACYTTPGCGYCIDGDYDSACLAGDHAGPFARPDDLKDCKKQWTPGVSRPKGSMCVMVLSPLDVRCYEQCSYDGSSIAETFVVPSAKACDQYDTAFKQTKAAPAERKAVHEHIAQYLLQAAVKRAGAKLALALTPNDMTRELIGDGLRDLEKDGLGALEDGCCDYFTGDAFGFCGWTFTQDVESYVNDEVLSIPLVQNVNNWLVNTADEYVPSGVRNVIDDVADVYNTGKSVVDACESAGSAIVHGLFGWL